MTQTVCGIIPISNIISGYSHFSDSLRYPSPSHCVTIKEDFVVAAVFSYTWVLCPSGYPREHKPLDYARLKLRKSNFGSSGSMGRVLVALRS